MHHPHVRYRRTTTLKCLPLKKSSYYRRSTMVQIAQKSDIRKESSIYVHITRSPAGRVAYIRYRRDQCETCAWTAELLKPWVRHCLDVYIRSLFISSFRFSIHFWYLRLFYSDGFPYFIAPAFSTPAFSTPAIYSRIFHSCIFHSRIFSAPDRISENNMESRAFCLHGLSFSLTCKVLQPSYVVFCVMDILLYLMYNCI